MIILRQNNYSFIERVSRIMGGALAGSISSLVFAIPVGLISKLSGGSFQKSVGIVTLGGAILGALLGNSLYSSDKARKEFDGWKEKNQKALEDLVKKNLPPKMNNLHEFNNKVNELNEKIDSDGEFMGYEIMAGGTIDGLITLLAPILYKKYKNSPLPESHPIPVLEIWTYDDFDSDSSVWILWYDKKEGWVHEGKRISGPKKFILDCINNKFNVEYYRHNFEEFCTYEKKFIDLVNKYLW